MTRAKGPKATGPSNSQNGQIKSPHLEQSCPLFGSYHLSDYQHVDRHGGQGHAAYPWALSFAAKRRVRPVSTPSTERYRPENVCPNCVEINIPGDDIPPCIDSKHHHTVIDVQCFDCLSFNKRESLTPAAAASKMTLSERVSISLNTDACDQARCQQRLSGSVRGRVSVDCLNGARRCISPWQGQFGGRDDSTFGHVARSACDVFRNPSDTRRRSSQDNTSVTAIQSPDPPSSPFK